MLGKIPKTKRSCEALHIKCGQHRVCRPAWKLSASLPDPIIDRMPALEAQKCRDFGTASQSVNDFGRGLEYLERSHAANMAHNLCAVKTPLGCVPETCKC